MKLSTGNYMLQDEMIARVNQAILEAQKLGFAATADALRNALADLLPPTIEAKDLEKNAVKASENKYFCEIT
jgi:hypothetical protein